MKGNICLLLVISCIHVSYQDVASDEFYKATVVEYVRRGRTYDNIQKYKEYIYLAAQNETDIIVFPESALIGRPRTKSLVPSPEENVIPFKNETYDEGEAMSQISRAAAEGKIYVVVNLLEKAPCRKDKECPPGGHFTYNTNVVFDRNGKVVARYRKYNLFDEFGMNHPQEAELVSFTTDFGVTFGTFTCFDILFPSPAVDLVKEKNITNFIFPTYWFGELPFLTAVQAQAGWSYSMNVNLLASGANNPVTGSTGSGFYHGRSGSAQFMTEAKGDYLITAMMPKTPPGKDKRNIQVHIHPVDVKESELSLLSDPSQKNMHSITLDQNSTHFHETVCSREFCCAFNIKYRRNLDYDDERIEYRAVAYRGIRNFGLTTKEYVEYCAVVVCTAGDCTRKPQDKNFPLIFDSITVRGDFNRDNSIQMPDTLIWFQDNSNNMNIHTMEYNSFHYTENSASDKDKKNISIQLALREVDNLMTFGIFGRNFNSGSNKPQMHNLLLSIPFFFIRYFT